MSYPLEVTGEDSGRILTDAVQGQALVRDRGQVETPGAIHQMGYRSIARYRRIPSHNMD